MGSGSSLSSSSTDTSTININTAYTSTFTFTQPPPLSLSDSTPLSFDHRPPSLFSSRVGIKRRRPAFDQDFDGERACKKRRLRLMLITSRLSRPFSSPCRYVSGGGGSSGSGYASPRLVSPRACIGRSLLRKAAIVNWARVRRGEMPGLLPAVAAVLHEPEPGLEVAVAPDVMADVECASRGEDEREERELERLEIERALQRGEILIPVDNDDDDDDDEGDDGDNSDDVEPDIDIDVESSPEANIDIDADISVYNTALAPHFAAAAKPFDMQEPVLDLHAHTYLRTYPFHKATPSPLLPSCKMALGVSNYTAIDLEDSPFDEPCWSDDDTPLDMELERWPPALARAAVPVLWR